MTQTQTHPHRHDLRRRAERLIAALDATPAPQTLPDIMRAARTLMVIDRLLSQLWKTPPVKSGRPPAVSQAAPADDGHSDDTAEPALAAFDAPPLNRHQRRLKAAQERHVRPDSDLPLSKKPVPFPSPHDHGESRAAGADDRQGEAADCRVRGPCPSAKLALSSA